MKNCSLILLLFIAVNTGAIAQTMLKVHLADNSQINVSVDGRYFNKKGTSVTVGDLPPGRHKLDIYTVVQTRYGRGREEMVFSGKVFTHDGNITIFSYDTYNREKNVEEQDINSYTQNNPPPPLPPAHTRRPLHNGNFDNNPPQVNNNNRDLDNDNKYIPSQHSNAQATLTDVKIDQLKTRVMDKKTDTDRMNLMKDGLGSEKMTSDQVGSMMDWFNFEDSKVQFAKWAYPNVVDKENFAALESKISYQNYLDDLDKFIKDNNR